MSQMNMIQAIRSAPDIMLERDPTVVALGQDIGYFGGVFRCTEGLQQKYGEPAKAYEILGRAIDLPDADRDTLLHYARACSATGRLNSVAARVPPITTRSPGRLKKAPIPSDQEANRIIRITSTATPPTTIDCFIFAPASS